jgi:hypothetical protein
MVVMNAKLVAFGSPCQGSGLRRGPQGPARKAELLHLPDPLRPRPPARDEPGGPPGPARGAFRREGRPWARPRPLGALAPKCLAAPEGPGAPPLSDRGRGEAMERRRFLGPASPCPSSLEALAAPRALRVGVEACPYCFMTILDARHAAQAVNPQGKGLLLRRSRLPPGPAFGLGRARAQDPGGVPGGLPGEHPHPSPLGGGRKGPPLPQPQGPHPHGLGASGL